MTNADRALRRVRGGSVLGNDWEQKARQKIQASQILNRLIAFVKGEINLDPAQATTGIALIRKVLPDIVFVETKSTINHVIRAPTIAETDQQWLEHVPLEHRSNGNAPEEIN